MGRSTPRCSRRWPPFCAIALCDARHARTGPESGPGGHHLRMGVTATVGARVRQAPERDAQATAAHVERSVSRAMAIAHVVGAFDVFALLFFVLPMPAGVDQRDNLGANLVGFAIYLPVALWLGHHFGVKLSAARSAWMREGRPPDDEERARVLATP